MGKEREWKNSQGSEGITEERNEERRNVNNYTEGRERG